MKNIFLRLFGRASASASLVFGIAFVALGIYIVTNGHLIAAAIALVVGSLSLIAAILQHRIHRDIGGESIDDQRENE